MNMTYKEFQLELKFPFTIAKFSRTSTPVLLLEIEHQGIRGYGEASMVPYMGESFATANTFLSKVDWNRIAFPFDFSAIIAYLDDLAPGNPAIKAAIDIALHDLYGKLSGRPCYQLFGADLSRMPLTSYTIGIDKPDIIIKKVEDALAHDFRLLKIKLGCNEDKMLIETIRKVTDLPLFVDANQGWSDQSEAVEMTHWLKEQGVLLIEQPMDRENIEGNAYVTERSPIPIFGDEAVQRLPDIEKAKGVYHGINIKLMKSAGMSEAFKMIGKARQENLKILIGCMSETSIATMAGAALAPLCDFADLDGPFLTSNNPFPTPSFINGKYVLTDMPGLGVL